MVIIKDLRASSTIKKVRHNIIWRCVCGMSKVEAPYTEEKIKFVNRLKRSLRELEGVVRIGYFDDEDFEDDIITFFVDIKKENEKDIVLVDDVLLRNVWYVYENDGRMPNPIYSTNGNYKEIFDSEEDIIWMY